MRISYKVIGRNIRSARMRAGYTQERMADCLDISPIHYGRLERGDRNLSLKLIANAAEILHVPISELLHGMTADTMFPETTVSPQGIGMIIDFLAAGCSDEARGIMLDICRVIAEHDKYAK